MTTATIRKKLIAYITHANDKKVKGVYLLIEDDIENAEKISTILRACRDVGD